MLDLTFFFSLFRESRSREKRSFTEGLLGGMPTLATLTGDKLEFSGDVEFSASVSFFFSSDLENIPRKKNSRQFLNNWFSFKTEPIQIR